MHRPLCRDPTPTYTTPYVAEAPVHFSVGSIALIIDPIRKPIDPYAISILILIYLQAFQRIPKHRNLCS